MATCTPLWDVREGAERMQTGCRVSRKSETIAASTTPSVNAGGRPRTFYKQPTAKRKHTDWQAAPTTYRRSKQIPFGLGLTEKASREIDNVPC